MYFRSAIVIISMIFFIAGNALASSKEVITIKEIQKEQGLVSFTHKSHGEKFLIGCPICHHNNSEGKEQGCSKCHTEKTDGKKLNLKEAFHQQCRGCHQKKHGPVKCVQCHNKK